MAYTVGIALALLSFKYVPASAAALQWANVFMIGFFLYGPQVRWAGGMCVCAHACVHVCVQCVCACVRGGCAHGEAGR